VFVAAEREYPTIKKVTWYTLFPSNQFLDEYTISFNVEIKLDRFSWVSGNQIVGNRSDWWMKARFRLPLSAPG
jgi:hypothetical protein